MGILKPYNIIKYFILSLIFHFSFLGYANDKRCLGGVEAVLLKKGQKIKIPVKRHFRLKIADGKKQKKSALIWCEKNLLNKKLIFRGKYFLRVFSDYSEKPKTQPLNPKKIIGSIITMQLHDDATKTRGRSSLQLSTCSDSDCTKGEELQAFFNQLHQEIKNLNLARSTKKVDSSTNNLSKANNKNGHQGRKAEHRLKKPLHVVSNALSKEVRSKTGRLYEYLYIDPKHKTVLQEIQKVFNPNVKEVGKGGFGKTYLVKLKGGREFIVKQMLPNNFSVRNFVDEIAAFYLIGLHPNIIVYYGCFQDKFTKSWTVVLEKADMDLKKYMQTKHIKAAEAKNLKEHMFLAVRHLHNFGLAHTDLKTANMVVFKPKVKGEQQTILLKLIDFGGITSDVNGKRFSSTYTSEYINKTEYYAYLLFYSLFKTKNRRDIVKYTKERVRREIKGYKVFDATTINNIFNWTLRKLKSVKPMEEDDDLTNVKERQNKMENAWKNNKDWQKIAYLFIKYYQRRMADIYALGKIFAKLGRGGHIENKVEQLYDEDPFKRPSLEQIHIWLKEGYL